MSPLEGKIEPSSQTLSENLHTYRKEFLGSQRCDKETFDSSNALLGAENISFPPSLSPPKAALLRVGRVLSSNVNFAGVCGWR